MGFPSTEAVAAALTALGAANVAAWAPALATACQKHGIATPECVASFLANLCHESNGLRAGTENLNYPRDRLIATFGATRGGEAVRRGLGRPIGSKVPLTEAQQKELANCVYGGAWGLKNLGNTQPNDGWYFRGKGPMQLTGRANHTRFAKAIGIDVVQLQAMLETPEGGAESAAMFWSRAGCNACAQRGDDAGARQLVNGGSLGLDEVRQYTARALPVLKAAV